MGMFDTITVKENTLGIPTGDYQSKGLDCSLISYVFTGEGNRLSTLGETDYHWGGREEYDKIKEGKFTDSLNFYGDQWVEGKKQWVEYNAWFEDNELVYLCSYDAPLYTKDEDKREYYHRKLFGPESI